MGVGKVNMKRAIKKSSDSQKRVAYAVGHLQGVQQMLNEGRYCIDVIKQIDAVEGSLKKLKQSILENHLHNCVVETIKTGTQRQKSSAIKELLEVYKVENK